MLQIDTQKEADRYRECGYLFPVARAYIKFADNYLTKSHEFNDTDEKITQCLIPARENLRKALQCYVEEQKPESIAELQTRIAQLDEEIDTLTHKKEARLLAEGQKPLMDEVLPEASRCHKYTLYALQRLSGLTSNGNCQKLEKGLQS